nr:hypothetical protein [uncultured Mitsuokella sp.]
MYTFAADKYFYLSAAFALGVESYCLSVFQGIYHKNHLVADLKENILIICIFSATVIASIYDKTIDISAPFIVSLEL